MSPLSDQPSLYRLGFCLHFVALMLFVCSVAIPGIWIYDQENKFSSTYRGLSLWQVEIRTCTSRYAVNSSVWRCDVLPIDHAKDEKLIAVCLLLLAALCQLSACILITLYISNYRLQQCHDYCVEQLAGLAATLGFTGILIYLRYTIHGANVTYGPGFGLHVAAIFIAYVGLLLTALFNNPPKLISNHRRVVQF